MCDEHEELGILLNQLFNLRDPEDEIVVLMDANKLTPEVNDVIQQYRDQDNYHTYRRFFKNDFADHKNFLMGKCTGDYMVQLDADEHLSDDLAGNLKYIIQENSGIDVFFLPRMNTLTPDPTREQLSAWGWNLPIVSQDGTPVYQWPDYQGRVCKLNGEIKWKYPVHERLVGMKSYTYVPQMLELSIVHDKKLDRQIKQNQFYDTI